MNTERIAGLQWALGVLCVVTIIVVLGNIYDEVIEYMLYPQVQRMIVSLVTLFGTFAIGYVLGRAKRHK